MTGMRPSAPRATASTTVRRSAAERLPASPIVPVATTPWMPASSSAPRLPSRPARSIAPEASNGVVTAGMIPGKRMWLFQSRVMYLRTRLMCWAA